MVTHFPTEKESFLFLHILASEEICRQSMEHSFRGEQKTSAKAQVNASRPCIMPPVMEKHARDKTWLKVSRNEGAGLILLLTELVEDVKDGGGNVATDRKTHR